MHIPLLKRLTITFCNIFFPPLAVALLTGPTSRDTLLNACLFLLAIIPSHIHGFYISVVYFTRKRRVRNGEWPGKSRKRGVWSERVLTGGIGWEGARELKGGKGVQSGQKGEDGRGDGDGDRDAGYGSDFDNRRERRRSRRVSGRGRGTSGHDSGRSSKRVSRVQSRIQEPVETQTLPQETGQITSSGTRNSRTSRWVEEL